MISKPPRRSASKTEKNKMRIYPPIVGVSLRLKILNIINKTIGLYNKLIQKGVDLCKK